jgi:hypothetical protein
MKNKRLVLTIWLMIITGCQPTSELSALQTSIARTQTAIASFTPYPTHTPQPVLATQTPYPTYTQAPSLTPVVLLVTATSSATPQNTATPTATATRTPTPLPTLNFLQINKGAGNYLVNVEIAAGLWKNNSTLDNCYWKRASRSGNTIEEYTGKGGGTMRIAATDYRVEMDWNCGVWYFLGGG